MNFYFLLATLCIFALHCESAIIGTAEEKKSVQSCPLIRPVGCYNDRSRSANPALGRLLITDRDRTSKFYSGKDIDWFNFGVYLEDLACRCAKAARAEGFAVFGLQFYGECWGGPNAIRTFATYGKNKKCANEYFGDCEVENDEICVGRGNANFVFALAEPTDGGSGAESVV